MIISIWWDHANNPEKPWRYVVRYLDQVTHGDCSSMRDCWIAADKFIAMYNITQDNDPVHS